MSGSEDPRTTRAPGRLQRAWHWLGRSNAARGQVFVMALGFAVLAVLWLVLGALQGDPVLSPALGAMLVVTVGLGELSGRPGHVAIARLVGAATLVATLGLWATVGMV